jgi:outer membrane protein assembly factor BamA
VLRGYPDDAFLGRRFLDANVEYRFPLAHPQRGYRLLPVFVRHLHATLFADAGNAWSGAFRASDLKTSAGAALGADVVVGHALPLTFTAGLARGFAAQGETRAYFRAGLAF